MRAIVTRRNILVAIACLAIPNRALAKGRSIVIDARRGMTRDLYEDYKNAVLGDGHKRSVSKTIILHVSARLGFDAGYLVVPRHIRSMNTHIIIYVHHGDIISAPISVNLLSLDRRQIFNINQRLTMR